MRRLTADRTAEMSGHFALIAAGLALAAILGTSVLEDRVASLPSDEITGSIAPRETRIVLRPGATRALPAREEPEWFPLLSWLKSTHAER